MLVKRAFFFKALLLKAMIRSCRTTRKKKEEDGMWFRVGEKKGKNSNSVGAGWQELRGGGGNNNNKRLAVRKCIFEVMRELLSHGFQRTSFHEEREEQ